MLKGELLQTKMRKTKLKLVKMRKWNLKNQVNQNTFDQKEEGENIRSIALRRSR